MKLLIIFATSAVLLQYHFATTTSGQGGNEAESSTSHQEGLNYLRLPERLNEYELIEKEPIGDGNSAIVMLAKHKRIGERVAIKIIDKITQKQKRTADKFKKFLIRLKREVEIMKILDHPYIMQLFQFYETDDTLYIVMEYLGGGDMHEFVFDTHRLLSEKETRIVYRQLLLVLEYLQRKKIAHRDIKPRNSVFDENQKNIKVADFGLSEVFEPGKKLTTYCGSIRYVAPEIVTHTPLDGPKADLWSSGIILYLLMTGSLPFDNEDENNIKLDIRALNYDMPENVPDKCKALIRKILVKESDRPTLEEIMNDEWVNEGLDKLTPFPEPDPGQKLKEKNRRIKALKEMGYNVTGIETLLEEPIQYDNDLVAAYFIIGKRTKQTKKLTGLKKIFKNLC